MIKGDGIHAVGKRKTAVARVYLRNGSGNNSVNKKSLVEYFPRETLQMILKQLYYSFAPIPSKSSLTWGTLYWKPASLDAGR